MKRIISEPEVTYTIRVEELTGREIIAYRCPNSDSVHILQRLNRKEDKWGFVSLAYPSSGPTFIKDTFHECVKVVMKNRKPMMFDNQADLVYAIQGKKLKS